MHTSNAAMRALRLAMRRVRRLRQVGPRQARHPSRLRPVRASMIDRRYTWRPRRMPWRVLVQLPAEHIRCRQLRNTTR